MELFDDALIKRACRERNVADLSNATIGEVLLVAQYLEKVSGIPFVRMDQGSPSLPINQYGVMAEKAALDRGVGSKYPPADGIPELKEAASRFIKAFINIDVPPACCIPTTGSVEASFASFIACTQRIPGKDKILFLDPGFPIQKSQLKVTGIGWRAFDIAPFRGGAALSAAIQKELAKGDIAAIIYSNPNNPAWTCLEEDELKAIGELATRYDVVILEDLAYFCMDFRRDLGTPYAPPYLPTVARYTDNYILMLSASKIFSYAGQRIALCCISESLFHTGYEALGSRYGDTGVFGPTLTASILYMITSGCTYTTQYAYAEMLNKSCDGAIQFVEDTREYARRTRRLKDIFLRHGFHVVYDRDVTKEVGDGFFFTIGYGDIKSGDLTVELMKYGVSAISLRTTGGTRQGVRGCSASISEESCRLLDERMEEFDKDHRR